MCGIVGYIGNDQAVPVLLQGLEKLEYRGYDSAGVAVFSEDGLKVVKSKGRLRVLSDLLDGGKALTGTLGIGHTRWATHGAPSDVNSHPQVSEGGRFAVVHNGIIENYLYLKQHLMRRGVQFVSETDTEVVAQMLEYYDKGDILETIEKVISKVEGSYALGIISADHPDCIYAVRKDSPLIIGLGQGENFIASDIPAIFSKTREICRLKDNEIAELTRDGVKFYNADGEPVEKEIEHIEWDIEAAEKGGFEHFMMKEIFEQPKAVRDTITPRIRNGHIVLDDITLTAEELCAVSDIYACVFWCACRALRFCCADSGCAVWMRCTAAAALNRAIDNSQIRTRIALCSLIFLKEQSRLCCAIRVSIRTLDGVTRHVDRNVLPDIRDLNRMVDVFL